MWPLISGAGLTLRTGRDAFHEVCLRAGQSSSRCAAVISSKSRA